MNQILEDVDKRNEQSRQLHQKEREVLFENETLVVKMLQAVSGAAMVGGLAQTDTIIELAGQISFLVFLTAMGLALIISVFTAHWKHQYKMWDVKAHAAKEKERTIRLTRASRYLIAMRAGMWVSLVLTAFGFLQLIIFLWVNMGS